MSCIIVYLETIENICVWPNKSLDVKYLTKNKGNSWNSILIRDITGHYTIYFIYISMLFQNKNKKQNVYQDYSSMKMFFHAGPGALIGFLPSMCLHMHVKITCPWKCFITLDALIWFLPSMSHHMLVKTTLPWKCCITQVALIWFLPIMSHHMFIKTTLHWKCFFHTGCIDMVSSLYESSYAGLDYSSMKMLSNTGCTDMVSPQYESSYVYQEYSYVKMLSYTGNIYMVFRQNELSYAGQDPL